MSARTTRSLGILTFAMLAPLMLGACTGATSRGTPYTVKIDRELEGYVGTDLETAHYDAIRMLRNDYQFNVYYDALDAREGIIEAVTAKERRVRVETYYVSDALTRVEVFVTPFGDHAVEHDIFTRLDDRIARF